MKKINNDDFVILNDTEKDEAMGGIAMDNTAAEKRKKIECFLNYKLYACVSWEAHCDTQFQYGCDGGYMKWHCPRFCVNRKLEDSSFILESCFQI